MDYYGTIETGRRALQHFGIKGMKWGRRRFENYDGTLTEAGKKRYYDKYGRLTRAGKRRYRGHLEQVLDSAIEKEYRRASSKRGRRTANSRNARENTKLLVKLNNSEENKVLRKLAKKRAKGIDLTPDEEKLRKQMVDAWYKKADLYFNNPEKTSRYDGRMLKEMGFKNTEAGRKAYNKMLEKYGYYG